MGPVNRGTCFFLFLLTESEPSRAVYWNACVSFHVDQAWASAWVIMRPTAGQQRLSRALSALLCKFSRLISTDHLFRKTRNKHTLRSTNSNSQGGAGRPFSFRRDPVASYVLADGKIVELKGIRFQTKKQTKTTRFPSIGGLEPGGLAWFRG